MNQSGMLYPNVPDDMFANRETSIELVLIYGNILFTSGGQNLIKTPMEFLNHIMTAPLEDAGRQEIRSILIQNGRSTPETLFPNSIFEGPNRNVLTLSDVGAFVLGDLLKVLLKYCEFLSEHPETSHASVRGYQLFTIHMGICKMGEATAYSRAKIAHDFSIFTNHEMSLTEESISAVYRYGSDYINEQVALAYFRKLYFYIPRELTVNFKNMHKYTFFSRMASLKFVMTALSQFPAFPWERAYIKFMDDFHNFIEIARKLWFRPLFSLTKNAIDEAVSGKRYESLAYLCQQILVEFGTGADKQAKGYKGFNNISQTVREQGKEMIIMFKYQMIDPVNHDITRPLHERRTQFSDSGFKDAIIYALANEILSTKLVDMLIETGDMVDAVCESWNSAQTEFNSLNRLTSICAPCDTAQMMIHKQNEMLQSLNF